MPVFDDMLLLGLWLTYADARLLLRPPSLNILPTRTWDVAIVVSTRSFSKLVIGEGISFFSMLKGAPSFF